MLRLDLEKAEEPEIKFTTSNGSYKNKSDLENIYFFIDCVKAFDYVK